MARHEFDPARALLPRVLARLSRSTGSVAPLRPVWDDAVGALAAKNSRPIALDGRTLIVEVESRHWAAELEGHAQQIRSNLAQRLGEGTIEQIVYRCKTTR